MLRVCLKSSKPHFDFNIQKEYIAGRLNIGCFVSVKALIPNYTNIGFHEDYSNCESLKSNILSIHSREDAKNESLYTDTI